LVSGVFTSSPFVGSSLPAWRSDVGGDIKSFPVPCSSAGPIEKRRVLKECFCPPGLCEMVPFIFFSLPVAFPHDAPAANSFGERGSFPPSSLWNFNLCPLIPLFSSTLNGLFRRKCLSCFWGPLETCRFPFLLFRLAFFSHLPPPAHFEGGSSGLPKTTLRARFCFSWRPFVVRSLLCFHSLPRLPSVKCARPCRGKSSSERTGSATSFYDCFNFPLTFFFFFFPIVFFLCRCSPRRGWAPPVIAVGTLRMFSCSLTRSILKRFSPRLVFFDVIFFPARTALCRLCAVRR